jgi:Secretion system C-terminal sorting domain
MKSQKQVFNISTYISLLFTLLFLFAGSDKIFASDLLVNSITKPASSVIINNSFKPTFVVWNINIFDALSNEWHVVVKITDANEQEVFSETVSGVFLAKGSSSNPSSVTLETNSSFTPTKTGTHTVTADVNYSQDINTSNDKETKQFSVIELPKYSISGIVLEEINYGGNRGFFTGTPRPNVIMELYSSGGTFIKSTVTTDNGSYIFPDLLPDNYTVRATNYSVTSSRPRNGGAEGFPIPVQTYRTDASSGTPDNVNDKVGGEEPSKIDAIVNSGGLSLSALTTSTTTPQSITIVKLTNKDVTGVNFVFNFSTIVNTNSEEQGSLRQFIINSNTLSNNGLAQAGKTAGIESSIFMIPSSSDPLNRPADPNFTGTTFDIKPTSELPPITDRVKLDGFIQTGLSGDTHPDRPEIVLDGSMAGETSAGLSFLITDCRLTGLIIQKFGGNGIFCNSKIYLGTVGEANKSVECLLNGFHGIQSKSADYVGDDVLIVDKNFGDGIRIEEDLDVDGIWARDNSGWGAHFGKVFRIRRDVSQRNYFLRNGLGGISGLTGLFSGSYVACWENGEYAGQDNINEGHGIIAKTIFVDGAESSQNVGDGFNAETIRHRGILGSEQLSADFNGGDGIYVTGSLTADGLYSFDNAGWGVYSESGSVNILKDANDTRNFVWQNGLGGISVQSGNFKGIFMDISDNGDLSEGENEGYGIIAKHIVVNGLEVNENRNDGVKAESITHTRISGMESLLSINNGGDGINCNRNIVCERLTVTGNNGWGAITNNGRIIIKPGKLLSSASQNKQGGLSAKNGSVTGRWLISSYNGELAESSAAGHGIIAGRVTVEEVHSNGNNGDGIRAHVVNATNGYSISDNMGYGIIGSVVNINGITILSNKKGGVRHTGNVSRSHNLAKFNAASAEEDYTISIENSTISDNEGNGIDLENFESALVQNNNILRNSGFDLFSSEKTIIANNNWWGVNSLPSNNINDLVTVENWLADSLSLFIFSERGSYAMPSGKSDSLIFTVVNITNLEDSLTVNISDSLGWLEEMNYGIGINDTTAGSGTIIFSIPNSSTEQNKITISATSVNSGNEVIKDLLVSSYVPLYSDLIIMEDSLTIGYGDSINYSAMRIDQNGNESEFSSTWSSSMGSIENSGKFIADSTSGSIEIMVQDAESDLSKTTHLYITNEKQILSELRISPENVDVSEGEVVEFSVTSKNQFNFPMEYFFVWEATGGTIDINGLFIAGESDGIYQVSVSDSNNTIVALATINILVGVELESKTLPKNINLSQNYPNPFNPNTTINFSIPKKSFVSLKVYDVLGREIKELVSGEMKPGFYNIPFGSKELSSGIYFYKLEAGDFIETKKMILLK